MSMIAPSAAETFQTLYDPILRRLQEIETDYARLKAENAALKRHLNYILQSFKSWEQPPTEPPPVLAPAPVADESFLQDRPQSHENGLVTFPDEQAVA